MSYWQTGSEISLAPVVLGGLIAGYLSTWKTGESRGVGTRAGVIGGLPIVWMLFDVLGATRELTGSAWFVTGATIITIGFVVVLLVVGFGLSALVGSGGAKLGSWVAKKQAN
jgi:hypothetical protein